MKVYHPDKKLVFYFCSAISYNKEKSNRGVLWQRFSTTSVS